MIYRPVQRFDWCGYDVVGELGSGLSGAVYVARRHEDGRLVALKLLHADAEPLVREHFWAELRLLRKAAHPCLPRYVDGGQHGGRPFVVTELVEGTRLDTLLARRWPPSAAAALIAGLAVALDRLHIHHPDAPVVHADVGPHNVIVRDDGTPVLVDLGAAQTQLFRAAEHASLLAQAYCAPEQLDHIHLPAGDQFALAALAFELLAGRPLRQHPIDRARAWTPISLSTHLPRRMQATCTVLARGLHHDPRKRYGSCGTLALQLHDALRADRRLRGARATTVRQVLRRQHTRRRRAAFIGLFGLLLVCLLAVLVLLGAVTHAPVARGAVQSPAPSVAPTATLAPELPITAPVGVAAHPVPGP